MLLSFLYHFEPLLAHITLLCNFEKALPLARYSFAGTRLGQLPSEEETPLPLLEAKPGKWIRISLPLVSASGHFVWSTK